MSKIVVLIRALRVYQWSKNLLVLAALVFSRQMLVPEKVATSLLAMACFCMAASATYLFNDLRDIEQDRAHPEKRNRPIASGALPLPLAWALALGLFGAAFGAAYFIRFEFLLALLFYSALTTAYSLLLKDMVIIDVLAIAVGFVARAMAGALAIDVAFSNWLVVCTLFLAMFLGFAKRRQEITLLESGAGSHREVHLHYTVPYLDQLILVVAGAALITYTIYTCSPEVVENFGTDKLYITVPFVVYGLFRYLHLVHHREGGGDPSRTLLRDWPLALNVALWAATCGVIIYL